MAFHTHRVGLCGSSGCLSLQQIAIALLHAFVILPWKKCAQPAGAAEGVDAGFIEATTGKAAAINRVVEHAEKLLCRGLVIDKL